MKKVAEAKKPQEEEMSPIGLANHLANSIADFHKKAKMKKKPKKSDEEELAAVEMKPEKELEEKEV